MILKSARVSNFKCVYDSEPFSLDPKVTCLVGKNESGKTAILQCLEKVNPVGTDRGAFDDLEYPRAFLTDFQESEERKDAISTTWEMSDDDVAAIEEIVGAGALESRTFSVQEGYYKKSYWTVSINEEKAYENFIAASELHEEEKQPLTAAGSPKAARELLNAKKADATTGETLSTREQKVLEDLKSLGKNCIFWQPVVNKLGDRLPKMVYFNEYMKMPGQVSLADLEQRKAAQDEPGNQVFLALLAMIGHDLDSLKALTTFEHLQGQLEAASNRLTRDIFQYWSQNKSLRVQFRFEQALPGDQPPFNSGFVMRTRIENTRHGVTTSFDERSTGFVWFFSFLVWFSQIKRTYGDNIIILLDEPGLALHAKAQADLLRYMEEKLAPKHQVVYTTHSPFMVDSKHFLRTRTVEDVFLPSTDDGGLDQDLGTKVGDDVLSTDRDTLFPLQACLGYEITQSLFVGEHSLLVEGPSEILYLSWFSRKLESLEREGLDKRWTLVPCSGIDKIPPFLSLFSGQNLHVAVLTDYATGQKGSVERVRRSELLQEGHVFTADQFADQSEADIEDVLGRKTYVRLVNECYGLKGKSALPARKPSDASERVVKEVEAHFRTVATTGENFDHYRPSEFLTQQGSDFKLADEKLSLDRFEGLFRAFNALLP